MKIRSLLFALSTLALALPAYAQEAPEASEPVEMQEMPGIYNLEPRHADDVVGKTGGSLMEEAEYIWGSRHFTNLLPDNDGDGFADGDSNRTNLPMPFLLTPTIEIRGYAQMFAPGIIYQTFSPLTADTTSLVFNDLYYEQFKDAGSFTIDSLRAFWFKNPNAGTPLAGAKFYVFRSPSGIVDKTYFANATPTGYRTRGARFDREELPIAFEAEITPEGIDTSLNGNFIAPLFIQFDEPLTFAAGTFAIPAIVNDEGEALPQPVGGQSDIRDFQIMAAFWEWRSGRRMGFGTGQDWKTMGLAIRRPAGEFSIEKDTLISINRQIVYTIGGVQFPAVQDMWMNIYGAVDLNAGVKYHYGNDVSSQGLGSPIPNPATSASRIPFSLTEPANISLDLFDVNGTHLRTIVQSRYVPGNYTAPLPLDDLSNGTYLVRMTANDKVYSMKVNVAK